MSAQLVAPVAPARPQPTERPVRCAGPCTMIIFGASGDLTHRKLMPAISNLAHDQLLDPGFSVIGVSGGAMTDDAFRADMDKAIATSDESVQTDAASRAKFLQRVSYIGGDLRDGGTYATVKEKLAAVEGGDARGGGRLFYLAIPPSLYPDVVRHLAESGLAPREQDNSRRWARVIIEKPFGHDLESAHALNTLVRSAFAEKQIYRIDHYLGKETVQNLLVHRFANSIFEPIWNRDHVHHVQITAAETVGVEHRARYYEEAGVIRDMFQNHLLQLLALTAMEPPNTFSADAVRNEKVKIIEAIRDFTPAEARRALALGQYGPGTMDGKPVPGYRQEPGVDPESRTPTFAALRLDIQNWRWQGVPFFLRSGKRMARHVTEIAVQFRRPPHTLFKLSGSEQLDPNLLAFRIQPEEGISLRFEVKAPGVDIRVTPVRMIFSYADAFGRSGEYTAYETLILDCMQGDATLFDRADSVEEAWRLVDPLVEATQDESEGFPNYAAGSWGPACADELIGRDGAVWRTP